MQDRDGSKHTSVPEMVEPAKQIISAWLRTPGNVQPVFKNVHTFTIMPAATQVSCALHHYERGNVELFNEPAGVDVIVT